MWSGRKGEERRECILNSTPLKSRERREFILNSTPLESSFVFCISLFEKSEE